MSITVESPIFATGDALPKRWHWTREQFEHLIESGFFEEDDRVELIQGELYVRELPSPFHSGTVGPVSRLLEAAFGAGYTNREQQPLITNGDSLPQPDIAVCVGTDATFRKRYPNASEVSLVVEVADTTVSSDRSIKQSDYAHASIPEYWIINLRDNQLEIFRDPDSAQGEYQKRNTHAPGDSVTPLCTPNAPIAVNDLLGL